MRDEAPLCLIAFLADLCSLADCATVSSLARTVELANHPRHRGLCYDVRVDPSSCLLLGSVPHRRASASLSPRVTLPLLPARSASQRVCPACAPSHRLSPPPRSSCSPHHLRDAPRRCGRGAGRRFIHPRRLAQRHCATRPHAAGDLVCARPGLEPCARPTRHRRRSPTISPCLSVCASASASAGDHRARPGSGLGGAGRGRGRRRVCRGWLACGVSSRAR